MEIFNDLILVTIEDQDIIFLTCAKVTQARPTNKYKTSNIDLLFIFVLCSVVLRVISSLENDSLKRNCPKKSRGRCQKYDRLNLTLACL
jgi:hypothetical protein